MPKAVVSADNLPRPGGPYSPVVKAGGFIFVAGQAAVDPATGKIVGTTIEEQTSRTLQNVQLLLEAAGAKMEDVVKVSVFLVDVKDFDRMNSVYKTFFPREPPARTTVEGKLVREGLLVEIDAVAYKP